MNTEARRKAIYERIKACGEISVHVLSHQFDVSGMTIRRDLDALESMHMIRRAYGKAIIDYSENAESSFMQREIQNQAAKQKISSIAIRFLDDIQSLFIDGSTTCCELVKMLPKGKNLSVFTNSVASLILLRQMTWINTIVLGGSLASDMNTLDGDIAINNAKNVYTDAAFISCSGYSASGFVNNGISGTHVKRIMLDHSLHNYLLVDNSKFNKRGLFLLGDWNNIDTIITDTPPHPNDIEPIKKAGVQFIWE